MPSAATAVALYRVLAAGAMWPAPTALGKPFGMATPRSGATRRHWLKIGLAVDSVDLVAAVLAGRRGGLTRAGTVMCFSASALAAGLGAAALLSQAPPRS